MIWLRKAFGFRSARVRVHLAAFAGAPSPFVFINVANDGLSTIAVVRLSVAGTATDKLVEDSVPQTTIYPGHSKEFVIALDRLGLTQIFDPKNFRVHLATGEVFTAKVRTDVCQAGVTP